MGPAGKAGAKIEIRRDGDVRRHRLDVEGSEQPRIDADIGEIVLPFDDLTKRLRECLQRIVREAAEYHHAPCPRRSEERRVGTACDSPGRSRWSPHHKKKT